MKRSCRRRIPTFSPGAIRWLVVLSLVLVLPVIAWTQPLMQHVPAGTTGAATVTSHVRFALDPGQVGQGVWLAGFAAEPGGEPTLLSLTFAQVDLGWFGPLWGLQLQSDARLLPPGLHPQEGAGFFQGSQYALLQSITPAWGHEYEVQLGYDPTSGAASIYLYDKTEEKRVYARNVQLAPYEGPLYPAAGVAELVDGALRTPEAPVATVEELWASDYLLPVQVPWWVMQRERPDQSYRATDQIDRRLETVLRVSTPWTELKPQFALRLIDTEGGSALYIPYDHQLESTPVPVSALQHGRYTAVLEYSVGDRTWELDRKAITVGAVDVHVVHVEAFPVAEDRLALSGMVRVDSDGPLGRIAVGLDASVTHHAFAYDPLTAQGTFVEESGEPMRVLTPVELEIDGTGGLLEFAGELPLPAPMKRSSFWEVRLEPFSTPEAFVTEGVTYRTWVGTEPDDAPWEGFLRNEQVHTREIAPGVLLVTLSGRIAAGPLQIFLLVVDLETPGLTVDALVGAHLATPASSRWPRSQVSQMVEYWGAVAGVNASFFDISDSMKPRGVLLQSGSLLKTEASQYVNALAIDVYGKPYLGAWDWVGEIHKEDGSAYRPVLGLNVTDPGAGLVVYRPPATRSVGGNVGDIQAVELVVRELTERESRVETDASRPAFRGVVEQVRLNQPATSLTEGIFVVAGRGENAEYLLRNYAVGDVLEIDYRITGAAEWPYLDDWRELYAVVAGGVALLRNGVYGPGVVDNSDRHPRTAVGISLDQSRLYILVVDGRSSTSVGMTYREMADFFRYIGAFHALNFDGGGSSAMVVYDQRIEGLQVVNTPSDGRERYVPNGLGIFYSPPVAIEAAGQ